MPNISGQQEANNSRGDVVERARQSWIRKLIDLSRRNNLLYYRPLKTGTLDLSSADPAEMAALLSGTDSVSAIKLLPNGRDESVTNVLRDILRRAQANTEEKGLQTLFMALGMATWDADDAGRPADAPVLLVPLSIEAKGSSSFSFSRAGAIQVNIVLLHVLSTQFGIDVNTEQLMPVSDDDNGSFDATPLYAKLKKTAADVPGFDIRPSATLGNFAFQKMAMVKDLQERSNELVAHDVVAAIAGDKDARGAVSAPKSDFDPKELDHVLPENEFIVLDADSSQQCAIANVLAGQSAVIHGPPGTGKSQTIANLIATLAATGHRVLFVAEKRAALEVVSRRLKDVGLGHLAIDLHGADLSPRKVMRQVAETLERVRNAVPNDSTPLHAKLVDRRTRLNEHVRRLHLKREPTGMSVYQMEGKLLRLSAAPETDTRWRGEDLRRLNPNSAQHVCDLLAEAADFESLFLRNDPSPWTGVRLRDGMAVERVIDLVSRASLQTFPRFMASLHALLSESGLRWPASISEVRSLIDLMDAVHKKLEFYDVAIYEQNQNSLIHALNPGRSGGISGIWAWITKPSYRLALKTLRPLRVAGSATVATLLSELDELRIQTAHWQQLTTNGSLPKSLADFGDHKKSAGELFSELALLESLFPKNLIEMLTVDELGRLLARLASDKFTPQQLPKLTQIESELDNAGISDLVNEIRKKKPSNRFWPAMFQYAWLISTLDVAIQNDIDIRGFKGATHNRYVDEFVTLDETRISVAAERVRRAHGLRAIAAMNAHPEQQHLIRAEASKVKKHLPLRKVFAQASEVLTAVCPCWMASPLSVSQLLDGGKQYFDFVVFDEASQILPEDAIPAVLRGKRLVVAGDNKQLPPTTFFASNDGEDYASGEDSGASEGFESLLDMMIPFVRSCYLDWHYRSRDETLINFSNHYIYQERLVTFPGPGGPPAISHELVHEAPGIDGQEESCPLEVRKVVDLIIRHAREHPDETLGVITMGVKHMNRLQAALDRELEKHTGLSAFFDPNVQERFFIKNLERVQGDERDAIIISMGYGKDRAGNLPLRFGPLLSEGGRRRLNVAITRARQTLIVVSSFSHLDIDLAKVKAGSGVELLRNYLQYAASNGKRLGDGYLTTTPLNDFETDIFDVLTTKGMTLIPQLGASQFRIDMVAEHPEKPGRYVLAIECDGATYHSSYTARDRDRLRQQQLERLGWRFHRIWSTDWFMRKEEEVARAVEAFKTAVLHADNVDRGAEPEVERQETSNENNNSGTPIKARATRPPIPMKSSIGLYSNYELAQLIHWISSDGQLRTDDEFVTEMTAALGFNRKGTRIEAAIRSALFSYHSVKSNLPKS